MQNESIYSINRLKQNQHKLRPDERHGFYGNGQAFHMSPDNIDIRFCDEIFQINFSNMCVLLLKFS